MLSILAITEVTQGFKIKNIRYIASILTVLIIAFQQVSAQADYSDFHAETDLNSKSAIALELWNYYLSNNIDSLKIVGAELLHEAISYDHDFGKAVAYRIVGEYEIWNGQHDTGTGHIQTAARHFISCGNYLLYSECLVSIGNSFFLQGDLEDAQKAYMVALEAGNYSGDRTAWFAAELNLSKVYAAQGDTLKAIEFAEHFKNEALRLDKNEAVSNAYGFLADLMPAELKSEKKLSYLNKSVMYAQRCGSVNQLSHAWNNLAIHYFYSDHKDSAAIYFQKSLSQRKASANSKLICESYLNLANYYLTEGQVSLVKVYADSSLSLALTSELNTDAEDALELKCEELEDEYACEELRVLRSEINELQSRDSEILKSLLSIYEERKMEQGGKQNGWITSVLTLSVLITLGLAVYRR